MSHSKTDVKHSIASLSFLTVSESGESGEHQVVAQINQDIMELNVLIKAYNQASNDTDRITCLQQLDNRQQRLGVQYPDNFVTLLSRYRFLMHKQLFNAMHEQRNLLQVRSDYQPKNAPYADMGTELADILLNMVPEQYAKFMAIMATAALPIRTALLTEVYPNDAAGDAYRAFMQAHDIEFIGGFNSRNFKFTHHTTRQAVVVRFSDNLDVAKHQEYDLRERLQPRDNFLMPQWADRRASYEHPTEGIQSGRISVIALNLGKTLNKILWHTVTLEQQQQGCIDVCLAQVLLHKKLYLYDKAWPDGKNDNIFFHLDVASGRLVATVADCKAFCALKPNHQLGGSASVWIVTDYKSAPEVLNALTASTPSVIDADKMAIYTIGKNLYDSLLLSEPKIYQRYYSRSQTSERSLADIDEFTNGYFKLPIFKQNAMGKALKGLVKAMVKYDATQRLSSDEVLQRLIVLKYNSQPRYLDLVEKIKQVLSLVIENTKLISKRDRFMLQFYKKLFDKRHDIEASHLKLDNIFVRYQEILADETEHSGQFPLKSTVSYRDELKQQRGGLTETNPSHLKH